MDPVTALLQLKSSTLSTKEISLDDLVKLDLSCMQQRTNGIKRTFESINSSADVKSNLPLCFRLGNKAGRFTTITSSTGYNPKENKSHLISPKDKMIQLMCEAGFSPRFRTARDLQDKEDYFLVLGKDNIEAYCNRTVSAIREQDFETLKKVHDSNPRFGLQCCNQFGESVLHMACRRGFANVVDYLIKECAVKLRLTDDSGRTPMHDACWTTLPNPALMKTLLAKAPELLLVKDARGHTPLDYVSSGYWTQWNDFLDDNKILLVPQVKFNRIFKV